MKRKCQNLIPQTQSLSSLILTILLSQSIQNQIKLISKLQNKKIKTRKGPIQKKIDLKIFCENSLFDSLFLVNLSVPLGFSVCFEKLLCMAFYIEKMRVWNSSQTISDLFQTSVLMQKKTCFSQFLEPQHAYTCMKLAYTDLENAYAYTCLCTHALRFSWPFFFQKQFYLVHKRVILSVKTFFMSN